MKKFVILLFSLIYSFSSLATEEAPLVPEHSAEQQIPRAGFADIVEPLMPAVVNIYTVKYNKKSGGARNPFSDGFPFDQFNDFFEQFNLPFNFEDSYSDPKAVALGSGFIIAPEGFIVTNHHVVGNADEIHIKLLDNTEIPAKLIGSDPRTDLALLKVEAKTPLPFVKFGDSDQAKVGDWVIAIGNPFGLGGTVTTGIISSKARDLNINPNDIVDDFIQTDAAINGGNSGGPMFNLAGEVIGINTAIFSPSGMNVGIGFAIPAKTAGSIIDQLKSNGKISRGKLDVIIQEVTSEIAEGLGLKEPEGVVVTEVVPGGAADKAGIKSGDVIIEFASQPVKNSRKLQILVAETPVNKETPVKVIREGKTIDLTAKITETSPSVKPHASKNAPGAPDNLSSIERSDITFSDLTDELRQRTQIGEEAQGVVVTAFKEQKNYGLRLGDLVMAVNQQLINSTKEFDLIYEKAKNDKKKNVVLWVKRRSANIFVALPIK